MAQRPTRAGSRLLFTFQKTEIYGLLSDAVTKIETEAYAQGYTDADEADEALLDPDFNPDEPVIPTEAT